MVLHYAHLCAAAGGVDAFLIGTEMRGITQVRDGPARYPAVAAFRDLAADVRGILGSSTKLSYAADWSEYFGHHPGDGTGDVVFHLDPLWADGNVDFIGIDNYTPLSDWRDGFEHADAEAGWPAITDRAYLQANVEGGEGFDWFYATPDDRTAQIRTPITDALGKPWVFRFKDIRAWWSNAHYDRPGGVEAGTPTAWVPQSKPIRFTEIGCPAIDRGANQPNVFYDPKSSESFVPYFSRGWRDDAIQRAYLEAAYLYWTDPAHNPVSSLTGTPMITMAEAAAWTWDARPYPLFPGLTDVWTDGGNWRRGHWLTGRLGSVSLAALVRHLCQRAGLPEACIDVSGLWGAVEGYSITALESPRASIAMLARHFGFDAVESGGVIRFRIRGRGPVATLAPDDLVATPGQADVLQLTRAQETELPQALKWSLTRADADYKTVQVEARRITVDAARVASEAFPIAVPPEEAERRCRRALMETWTAREAAVFRLPPSRLALDPADVVRLDHDGRQLTLRLTSTADGEARGIEAVLQDRQAYDLPPGEARDATPARLPIFGAPDAVLMDLPQLTEDHVPHRPLVAAYAKPWPGTMAVWKSPASDGFALVTTFGRRARMGRLAEDLYAGPVSRFDHGNAAFVELAEGTLQSVTDLALFAGANALAVESTPGVWEILQAGEAELLAPGKYRLTRLLRGQRGTEGAMGNPAPAGARVSCWTRTSPQSPSPRPISASPGPGASARRAGRSATRPTWRRPSRPKARGCGRSPSPMWSSRGATPRTPGDLTIRWTAGPARSRLTAGRRSRCRWPRSSRPTRSRSSTAPP